MKPKDFKDLFVWQKSMELVKRVYVLTRSFPKEEIYGLTSQLRRAAVSVPSNISEGQARRSTAEFLRFISYSRGSLAELETQILLSIELKFIKEENSKELIELITICQKMLNALTKALDKKKNTH